MHSIFITGRRRSNKNSQAIRLAKILAPQYGNIIYVVDKSNERIVDRYRKISPYVYVKSIKNVPYFNPLKKCIICVHNIDKYDTYFDYVKQWIKEANGKRLLISTATIRSEAESAYAIKTMEKNNVYDF